MQGSEVFKIATRTMVKSATELLAEHHVEMADVDYFFFHQANIRIIDHCARALKVDRDKMWVNVDRYGNTSAATLPVALDEAWRSGAVKKGDLMLFATFGGGLTWGSALIRL
jgi:3-oxoacyl-[acyl-carrier-protein] synthase-3